MKDNYSNIRFDRSKRPTIDFDIVSLEEILKRDDLDHDPKSLHRVHFYLLILITSGSGKHTIDFKEYEYAEGSVLTIRKNQLHNFHDGTADGFMLLFTEEFVLSYLEKTGANIISELFNELLFAQHTRLAKHEQEEVLTLVMQIQNEFKNSIDDHTSGILRNLLQVLIRKVYRIRRTSPQLTLTHKYTPKLLEFQKLVELHCHEFRSVKYYAGRLNITTKTLNTITRQVANKTGKKFIDDISLLNIKRLLINTDLSIKEIAYSSGFNETTNFFKFFKRKTYLTPDSFRNSYKKLPV